VYHTSPYCSPRNPMRWLYYEVANTLPRNDQGTKRSILCLQIPFLLGPNERQEIARNGQGTFKERFGQKLSPLSGKTAFLNLALWKNRIFKRKNAKPRNAGRSQPDATLAPVVGSDTVVDPSRSSWLLLAPPGSSKIPRLLPAPVSKLEKMQAGALFC